MTCCCLSGLLHPSWARPRFLKKHSLRNVVNNMIRAKRGVTGGKPPSIKDSDIFDKMHKHFTLHGYSRQVYWTVSYMWSCPVVKYATYVYVSRLHQHDSSPCRPHLLARVDVCC